MAMTMKQVWAAAGVAGLLVAFPAAGSDERAAARETQEEAREEMRAARERMHEAREELEKAAREMARLSREFHPAAPWPPGGNRAMLGVTLDPRDEDSGGVAVGGVTPGGPAEEVGLRAGDVLTAVDGLDLTGGKPRERQHRLIEHMGDVTPGDTVTVTYRRDGETREAKVETEAAPSMPRAPRPPMPPVGMHFRGHMRLGSMELVSVSPGLGRYFGTERGVLVVRAPENDRMPFRDGDVILTVGDREIRKPADVLRALHARDPGKSLDVTVMRDGERQDLVVTLPDRRDGARRFDRPHSRPA